MACKVKKKTPIFIDCDEESSIADNVDLGYTANPYNGVVTNTVGNDATIPVVNDTNAGLMTPTQKSKLDNSITEVDLSYTPNIGNGVIVNTAGDDVTIPAANSSAAGLMTNTDKIRLDYLYNSSKVSATFSSTGLLTSFTFNHNAGGLPSSFVVSAVSEDAQGFAYATASISQITVYYNVAPPVGTNNLVFNAVVMK